jgi:hypothetical protein
MNGMKACWCLIEQAAAWIMNAVIDDEAILLVDWMGSACLISSMTACRVVGVVLR